jgi:hypothetical protein
LDGGRREGGRREGEGEGGDKRKIISRDDEGGKDEEIMHMIPHMESGGYAVLHAWNKEVLGYMRTYIVQSRICTNLGNRSNSLIRYLIVRLLEALIR